jgi:orotate phosphoribosyltransferase
VASLDHLRRTLALDLLDVGAVTLSPEDPFTWSSGLRSPVYCDNRRTLGSPRVRRRIADGFAKILKRSSEAPTLIAGTATAGIPHATLLAARLSLPMSYVRAEAKGHGRETCIEGADPAGARVILIEDLVSTGGSALSAARALADAGADVLGVLAVFSYQLDAATDAFDAAPWPLHVLTGFSTLLDVAASEGELSEEKIETLRRWHRDPEEWDRASKSQSAPRHGTRARRAEAA